MAEANPWNGSWKMDPGSVTMEGAKLTVTSTAEGFTVKVGADAPMATVCDGKPHATPPPATKGAMYTCAKSATGYTVESTRDGKVTRKTAFTLAGDGKTITRKTETISAKEAPSTMTTTAKRLSGGPGMNGIWQVSNIQESLETGLLTIAVTGDRVAFKESDTPKPVECKLDGTEVTIEEHGTIAVKAADAKTLKVTYRFEGKVRRVNTFVLSADGKTVTETDVTPEPTPSKTSMVFHKL
jgi:hypothetical protein